MDENEKTLKTGGVIKRASTEQEMMQVLRYAPGIYCKKVE